MKYLLTRSTAHLKLPAVKVERSHFPDGELYIRISSLVRGEKITMITHITSDNLLADLFTIDAAKRAGGKIEKILIPYLGYARQDQLYQKGEALSISVVCKILKNLCIPIVVYDVHNEAIKRDLPFKSESFLPKLLKVVPRDHFVVVSPDRGGVKRAKMIAKLLKAPIISLKKTRTKKKVIIEGRADIQNMNVLIVDDMISTGTTLQKAAKVLKAQGAKDLYVIASHGLFTKGAKGRLKAYKRVFISNSFNIKSSNNIEVIECL